MSKVDQAIKKAGLSASIVRTPDNIETYVLIAKPKAKTAGTSYDFEAWMQTDSGVVSGDLIQIAFENGVVNYLAINVVEDERAGQFFKYNVRLLRCNHTITVKDFDDTTKEFAATTTGVPCLIIDGGASQMSDMGVVVPGFAGKDETQYLYCQPNSINKKSAITDEDGNDLEIAGEINPYFAAGIIEAKVKLKT